MAKKNNRDLTGIRKSKEQLKKIAASMNIPYEDSTPLKKKGQITRIFLSYSIHDKEYANKIIELLHSIKSESKIEIQNSGEIEIGEDWSKKIKRMIDSSDVILILLSPDLLASDYINSIEIRKAISLNNAGASIVIPIIVRPCKWRESQLSGLQVFPRDTMPISEAQNLKQVYDELVENLRMVINTSSPIHGIEDELSIEIKVNADFDKFSKKDANSLVKKIKETLALNNAPKVLNVKKGSVKINLELKKEDIEILYDAVAKGQFHNLDIISAEFSYSESKETINIAKDLRPRVFIGSSSEGLEVAEAIQLNLDNLCEVTVWSQGVFGLGDGTLETLVASLKRFDFAIMVLTPDDLTYSRDRLKESPRDNVLFELGLFMGHLGRHRTFIVFNRTSDMKLPSDLAGVSMATFQPHSSGNLEAALGAPCTRIKNAIKTNGRKKNIA